MFEADNSFYTSIGGTPAIISLVCGGIIAVVVTRYYANKGKNTKALGWIPLGITRIVRRPVTTVSEGLALTWKGEPLRTPYTTRLRISNIGTREIVGSSQPNSDYQKPLVVKFTNSTCYEAIITETSRTILEVPLSVLDSPRDQFEVPMPTLNISAWIELEIIADGEAEYPQLDCFLVGETQQIMPVAGRQRLRIRSSMLGVGGVGVVAGTFGFGLLGLQSFNPQGPTAWPFILMAIGALAVIGAALTYIWSWALDRQELAAMKRAAPSVFQSRRWGSGDDDDDDSSSS